MKIRMLSDEDGYGDHCGEGFRRIAITFDDIIDFNGDIKSLNVAFEALRHECNRLMQQNEALKAALNTASLERLVLLRQKEDIWNKLIRRIEKL